MANNRAATLKRIKSKNANERTIIEAVDKIVEAMGYYAGVGTTGTMTDDVLLHWTKGLSGTLRRRGRTSYLSGTRDHG